MVAVASIAETSRGVAANRARSDSQATGQIGSRWLQPVLIVNADDLGRSKVATDAVMSCYANGRVTSASAMVFMKDSERAAATALGEGLDVGLHVNFSEEFSAKVVPDQVRRGHARIRRFLRTNKYALLMFNPVLVRHFELVFASQLAEFIRLYGRQP